MSDNSTPIEFLNIEKYDGKKIHHFLGKAIKKLNVDIKSDDYLLIKPNLLQAPKNINDPVATNPQMILETARYFREYSKRVCIADSPSFGTTAGIIHRMGIFEDLKKLDVSILEFNQPVKMEGLPNFVKVDRLITEVDGIINLPKLKVHCQTIFTGATKNLFGCVPGKRKALLHFTLSDASSLLIFLNKLEKKIPIKMCIMDAVQAMTEHGPIGGKPYPCNLLLASNNCVAIDNTIIKNLNLSNTETCYDSIIPNGTNQHNSEIKFRTINQLVIPPQNNFPLPVMRSIKKYIYNKIRIFNEHNISKN